MNKVRGGRGTRGYSETVTWTYAGSTPALWRFIHIDTAIKEQK